MHFRIADTFITSLSRLTGEEQKAVKVTVFDLQADPSNPGMQFHKIEKSRDKNFWSVRVNRDLRMIVHRSQDGLLLCYVGHHDQAYAWAERRRLDVHPRTGAAQFVEVRERVEDSVVTRRPAGGERDVPVPSPQTARLPLAHCADEELLSYGVPVEWLSDVKQADEDGLLALAEHLPAEAAEAVLELATGSKPAPRPVLPTADAFAHPDAQRRFRLMTDVEELKRALEYPWDRWMVFLHPAQREWVEKDFNGPARVAGSAGTGKTVVALHRAASLARRHPDARVLLTTFSDALANALQALFRRLVAGEPRLAERVDIRALNTVGERLYTLHFGAPRLVARETVERYLVEAAQGSPAARFPAAFLLDEWTEIVDAWQLTSWEDYRTVPRLGRKTRLPEARRAELWAVFEAVNRRLEQEGWLTRARLFGRLAEKIQTLAQLPYDFVVVDEAQDMSIPQLRFLAAFDAKAPNRLFFAGDLGQRIFQQPFSWASLGVDVRGRSRTLRVNYRTSHQIRAQADRLLAPQLTDVDGNVEDRRGTVSVFNGPPPIIRVFDNEEQEAAGVADWLKEQLQERVAPNEIGIIVRSDAQVARAQRAAEMAGLLSAVLDERIEMQHGHASICTMPLAKGLEFRCVAVMACDDEVVPLNSRIENITDDSDLEEVYNTERHLLYVACTRARDALHVSAVTPASEFLGDLIRP
jgi:superfamily I DNA/RNA helicase/mRNA-degrading endonuclease RelE of RelBE toxin-antitoxin system